MSFTDRLMLWFHVAFVVFTIGPVTLATMSSPRAIRRRNVPVLRYQMWMTRIFGTASLGVFAFGMALGQSLNDLGKAWLTVSMTLFVVAVVLLVLITRDQRRAISALEAAARDASARSAALAAAASAQAAGGAPPPESAEDEDAVPGAAADAPAQAAPPAVPAHVASVERGRIASMAGVVSLIWLAILVLMVWNA